MILKTKFFKSDSKSAIKGGVCIWLSLTPVSIKKAVMKGDGKTICLTIWFYSKKER